MERKNSWQLAEHAGHASPDRFQRLLASSAWDEHGLREDVACWVTQVGRRAAAVPGLPRVDYRLGQMRRSFPDAVVTDTNHWSKR